MNNLSDFANFGELDFFFFFFGGGGGRGGGGAKRKSAPRASKTLATPLQKILHMTYFRFIKNILELDLKVDVRNKPTGTFTINKTKQTKIRLQ